MSRATMAAAAATLPRAPIYGIGRYKVGSGHQDFEIGWDDQDRDTEWARSILVTAGITHGDFVLISAGNHECPWISPIARGIREIGAAYVTAETYGWDARRFAMFLRRLPIKAIVGLGAETVDALRDATPPLSELLSGVDVVWARADALPQLGALGIGAVPYLPLGPALALGIPGEQGARINSDEWKVFAEDGRIMVSNKRTRRSRHDSAETGIRGTVQEIDGSHTSVTL